MPKYRLIWRILMAGIALALFVAGAVYLYNKQQLKINYLSFKLPDAQQTFIVPDIDRLIEKLDTVGDLAIDGIHPTLESGVNSLIRHKHFSFNRELSQECFISTGSQNFVIVFKCRSSLNALLGTLSEEFNVDAVETDKGLKIGEIELNADRYGEYLAVSNTDIKPVKRTDILKYGNADYVVFNKDDQPTRHILSHNYHFRVWEDRSDEIKGRGIDHVPYFKVVPADFEALHFYGSSRIQDDVQHFFEAPSHESFDWLSNGILYIKKGDMELVMAQQGDQRDLGLMLEEQTLQLQGDTAEINHFNIGNFKIMPFKTKFNWTQSISLLQDELKLYTEYNSFNLLANSIPAMRWFLRQVQLGNLIENNQLVFDTYKECLPQNAHYVSMQLNTNGGYLCQSRIYKMDSTCLFSEVTSGLNKVQMQGVEIVHDFTVDIVPTSLQRLNEKGRELILLNNEKQVAVYDLNGKRAWMLNLSTQLVEDPQIVDFNNDGIFEVVLFQSNQVDVVNNQGKSLNGYPVMYGGNSAAGLAVNYDNKFNWRMIVNVDNTVKVYSEEGKVVEGWMFSGMNSSLKGKIYHVITEGKDIITFKDKSNIQYVLSRRGERRLEQDVKFALPNETDFVVGSLESALRKMGYNNGFIYNYYILDGQRDSVAIDQTISPIRTFWEYNGGKPLLIAEEPDRLLIVNQFGYVQSEVLKPNQSNLFVGLVGEQDYGFVFADNSQNSIYLLNNFGKMILPQAVEGSKVSIIEGNLLFTFSGISVKAYKIAE